MDSQRTEIRRSRRRNGGAAGVLLLAVGCSAGRPGSPADAGRGASRDAGSSPDAVVIERPAAGPSREAAAIATRRDSSMPPLVPQSCDASAARTPLDATSPPVVDAGSPPTHCIAPCVWELMKNCRPAGGCFLQEYQSGSGPFGSSV